MKVGIFKEDNTLIFVAYTKTIEDALNSYASFRSGYETFKEMGASYYFRESCKVTASILCA